VFRGWDWYVPAPGDWEGEVYDREPREPIELLLPTRPKQSACSIKKINKETPNKAVDFRNVTRDILPPRLKLADIVLSKWLIACIPVFVETIVYQGTLQRHDIYMTILSYEALTSLVFLTERMTTS
jgi:hypothetical protein